MSKAESILLKYVPYMMINEGILKAMEEYKEVSIKEYLKELNKDFEMIKSQVDEKLLTKIYGNAIIEETKKEL